MFTKLKKNLSLLLQKAAHESAQFISELLLIKSVSLLHDELTTTVKKMDLKQAVQFQFELHYHKARMEFIRVFNIKNIDWEHFESNVLHIQPYWRKSDQQMPDAIMNRYATKIKTRIHNSQESFDPTDITAEFQQFLADGEAAIQEMKRKKEETMIVKNTAESDKNSSQTAVSQDNPALDKVHVFQFTNTLVDKQGNSTSQKGFQRNKKTPFRAGLRKLSPSKQQVNKQKDKHQNQNHHQRPSSSKKIPSVKKQQYDDFSSIINITK